MQNLTTEMVGINVEVVELENPPVGGNGNPMIGIGHEHCDGEHVSVVTIALCDAKGGTRAAIMTVGQAKVIASMMLQAIACLVRNEANPAPTGGAVLH